MEAQAELTLWSSPSSSGGCLWVGRYGDWWFLHAGIGYQKSPLRTWARLNRGIKVKMNESVSLQRKRDLLVVWDTGKPIGWCHWTGFALAVELVDRDVL